MIISRRYRYLFIENPQTASWAIRKELVEVYAGEPILHKHATYPEFRRIASPEERKYFVFITVRNPLDVLVSRYFKYLTDHDGSFSDPQAVLNNESDYSDRIKYEFVRSTRATFESYFLKFYRRPFSDLADLSTSRFEGVIRCVRLQEDFAEVLHRIGIQPVRLVSLINKTGSKKGDWASYYPPGTWARAKAVGGPFMQKWGYRFPAEWGDDHLTRLARLEFHLVSSIKNGYIYAFRNNNQGYARLIRRLRSALIS